MDGNRTQSHGPHERQTFSEAFDALYSRFAPAYDTFVKWTPTWRRWLEHALPSLRGRRVLEVSFGNGWLMTQYADRFEVHGIELNPGMLAIARRKLAESGLHAQLQQANVERLPYPGQHFDTVLCTMALSSFTNVDAALDEMLRVLAHEGRLVLIDVNLPSSGNPIGRWFVALWKQSGHEVRDVVALLRERGLQATDREIGGLGSVHLYTAQRPSAMPN